MELFPNSDNSLLRPATGPSTFVPDIRDATKADLEGALTWRFPNFDAAVFASACEAGSYQAPCISKCSPMNFVIMPTKRTPQEEHIESHKDGSIWAKGQTANGVPSGYWEWFRLDGTKMRSGHFDNGQQTGEWTTYDKKGQVYKVTKMKTKKREVTKPQR